MKKATLSKYIKAISSSKKKVYTIFSLSEDTGERVEIIQDNLVDYNPLINFDMEFDLKTILPDLIDDFNMLSNVTTKIKVVKKSNTKKEEVNYSGVIEYIYKKMTIAGGMLDLGYSLTKEDIKMIKKLLKKDQDKLN